mgnify:CR=1 FL=1
MMDEDYKEWRWEADPKIPGWLLEEWGLLDAYKGPGPWPNNNEEGEEDGD